MHIKYLSDMYFQKNYFTQKYMQETLNKKPNPNQNSNVVTFKQISQKNFLMILLYFFDYTSV